MKIAVPATSMFCHVGCIFQPNTFVYYPSFRPRESKRHDRTCALQANLEKEVEREKALAEAEGRIKENRENEDVNRRAMQLRLEEERKKLVEAINTTFTNLGTGTLALLTDREKLGTALAGLTVLALGVYSAREGTRVAGQVFSR